LRGQLSATINKLDHAALGLGRSLEGHQVLAMEAGIISRRKVVEATGYDVEEIDRENATDAKRAGEMGLHYRTSPGETQGARATPQSLPDTGAARPTPAETGGTDPQQEA